ncbi:DUF6188 family protein [Rhodoferax sp. OV413]|uniref:DUF6188 family protein n=1 Tax=Rhodoferax sp. OV413 TaxID=1855285 RepID=UPI000B88F5A3|nr:DUF6188 family protein [Rhodoferax sp. OV413]
MAGFSVPQDFPLGELVTQELTNVSIGRHYVRLLFTCRDTSVAGMLKAKAGAAIEIEAGFRLQTSLGRTIIAENSDIATGAAALTQLLGQTIVSVDRRPNNELSLVFSSQSVLLLTIDEHGFESYHLHVGGQSVDITKEF